MDQVELLFEDPRRVTVIYEELAVRWNPDTLRKCVSVRSCMKHLTFVAG